jgi:alpha-methylacyl-CoA racemase
MVARQVHKMKEENVARPLAGIRVIEFDALGPIPFTAMLFSDMGADVVRVARPDAKVGIDHVDRGRRIVYADLKTEKDRLAVQALIDQADIVLEGFRPGVLERLGFDPENLLLRNPRIVIGRLSSWGQTGPLAALAGHDINAIALAGVLAAIGGPVTPSIPLNLIADYGGGALILALAVVVATWDAQRTKRGRVVDCALCDSAAMLMSGTYKMLAAGEWRLGRMANLLDGGAPFYAVYACADGRHIAVGAIEPHFFRSMLEALGLSGDPRFASQYDQASWPSQKEVLEAIFLTRSRDEWAMVFKTIDACLTPVLDMTEAPTHPQLVFRGVFRSSEGRWTPAPMSCLGADTTRILPSVEDVSLEAVIQAWEAERQSTAVQESDPIA